MHTSNYIEIYLHLFVMRHTILGPRKSRKFTFPSASFSFLYILLDFPKKEKSFLIEFLSKHSLRLIDAKNFLNSHLSHLFSHLFIRQSYSQKHVQLKKIFI